MDVSMEVNVPKYPTLPHVDNLGVPDDWMYPMRRTMQEIIPGLFLGPYTSAGRNNLAAMKDAGLTHVVCVRAPMEAHLIKPNHPNDFQYHVVDMEDNMMEMVIPKVKTVTEFIDKCLNSNGKVLVHSNTGMSRSAILVIGYIMSKFGVTFKEAALYVQNKRFCIGINPYFANQLRAYEAIYSAMHSTPIAASFPGMSGVKFRTLKRRIDEIEKEDDTNDMEIMA